jgi:ribosome-binding protein aMBF1 (putative translation factor)
MAENQADRYRHGTLPHGEKSGTAKLTTANAIAIREEREAKGTLIRTLAQRYGVSMFTIRSVLTRKTWKHV